MKKTAILLSLTVCYGVTSAQNTFPSSGNVGIGTTTPVTLLEVKSGINLDGSSMGFIAPYIIGITHDVGAGQTLQYILLSPMLSSGVGNPSAGVDGVLSMYRGNPSTFNINSAYRIVIQNAYSTNHISVVPLSENSPMVNVYNVTYNGRQYAALKITEISRSSYNLSFRGQWWNGIDGTKPQLVDASLVTSVSIYKTFASVFGSLMFGTTSGNILIGKTSQANTSYKLDVNGSVRANQITVNSTGADYVFDSAYHVPSMDSLHHYIEQYHHLPGIAAAKEMQESGLNLGETQVKLLKNVEELTLYLIHMNEKVGKLQERVKQLEEVNNSLIKRLNSHDCCK